MYTKQHDIVKNPELLDNIKTILVQKLIIKNVCYINKGGNKLKVQEEEEKKKEGRREKWRGPK